MKFIKKELLKSSSKSNYQPRRSRVPAGRRGPVLARLPANAVRTSAKGDFNVCGTFKYSFF